MKAGFCIILSTESPHCIEGIKGALLLHPSKDSAHKKPQGEGIEARYALPGCIFNREVANLQHVGIDRHRAAIQRLPAQGQSEEEGDTGLSLAAVPGHQC